MLTITLPPELEARLETLAAQRGEDKERFVLTAVQEALDKQAPPLKEWQIRALECLRDLHTDDPAEQEENRQTFEYLERVIDEDRPGQRRTMGKGFNPMPDETPTEPT